jgi:hypothetical protein
MYSMQRKQKKQIIVAHSTSCIFAGSNSGNGFSSNADEIAVAPKGLYRDISL